MQAIQPNSPDVSVATKLEASVYAGETLAASASLLAATADPMPETRTDWSVVAEEDSSFFVPERCSPLDDF